ncbi:MAG TPA: hypothetical protein VIH72_07225 [Candidatus Acidoferrales bacterium]
MLRACRILLGIVTVLIPAANAQENWPPVPPNSHELVAGPAQILTSPEERATALNLVDRARQNYNFYVEHGPAWSLRVSFNATGKSDHEGQGTYEDTWLDVRHFRWSGEMGGSTFGRTVYRGQMWWINGPAPVPLRLQMARVAILWPGISVLPRTGLRMQNVNFEGSAVTCVLASPNSANPSAGRSWTESESCVDGKTGLLRVWSAAPGIYVVYDYTKTISFHGHTIASSVTYYEDEAPVLQIHVESITDPAGVSLEDFRPTPEIIAQGRAPVLGGPARIAVPAGAADAPGATVIQPVIVHGIVMPGGTLSDAEVITHVEPALAEQAIALAKEKCRCGNFPTQQVEILITVRMHVPRTQ